MSITLREYKKEDLPQMQAVWNDIVKEGNSFPQTDCLNETEAASFFAEQSYTGVADENGEIVGLYILHPNNIGRCGHIANSSYAVKKGQRGKGIGELLVRDSLKTAKSLQFQIMQFNAVVASNKGAIHLYQKLGFTQLGTIPKGFRLPDDTFADIILFYIQI